MEFESPSNELIDLMQYALMYGITVDWVPSVGRFIPRNLNIHRVYAETYGGPVPNRRVVHVDGTLAP